MHNHNGGNSKSMMWMMIPCLLLIVFVLFGGDGLTSSKYLWLIVVGVCVVPHIWMMFRGHGEHSDTNTEDKMDNTSTKHVETKKEDNKHKGGGCCH